MDPAATVQQAWRHYHANQLRPSEALARQLLQHDSGDPDALHLLGVIAYRQAQPQRAIEFLERALRVRPDSPAIYLGLGTALFHVNRLDEAERAVAESLRLNSNDPEAHQNMAILQRRVGNLELAADHFQHALELDPAKRLTRVYLAHVLRDLGRLERSSHQLHLALKLDPNLADAHMQLAWNHLLQGDFAAGWPEYEWRWRCPGVTVPRFAQPMWTGSNPSGKTILLYAEQGFGDTIQFVRYADLLAKRGATVVLFSSEPIRDLAATAPGVARAVSEARRLPRFDFWCPLLSLPLRFGTTLETIPAAVPYLTPDPARVALWKDRTRQDPPGLKVGLAWAGSRANPNDVHRSIPPVLFAPLARISNVVLYSLQVERDTAAAPALPLIDHTAHVRDFTDTAALVSNLDLVISVDTATAHLAGALGKPVWTLLSPVPEWRWLLNRSDSPWYPTMRLFRSPARDWSSPVDRVAADLRARAVANN